MFFNKKSRQRIIAITISMLFATFLVNAQIPNLVYPNNNSTCVEKNVSFMWDKLATATGYRLVIADVSDFSNILAEENVADTNVFNYSLPTYNKKYYWKILAFTPNGDKESNVWNFTTHNTPPNLVSPANNLICADTNITFKWNFSTVISYRLQVSEDPTFKTTFVDKNNISDTSYKLKLPKFNTKYYWRVASTTPSCAFAWSETNNLQTKVPAPVAIYPTDKAKGATTFNVTPFQLKFLWHKVASATNYNLQISKKSDFSVLVFDLNTVDTNLQVNLGTEYDSLYYWKLKTTTANCESYFSEPNRFYTPHPKAVLVSPIDEENCIKLHDNEFKWNPIQNTTGYKLQISDSMNFAVIELDTIVQGATVASVNLKKNNNKYYYRLRADDARNNGLWSNVQSFQTTFRPPNLVSPAKNKTGVPKIVTFNWEGFDTNYRYQLQIAKINDFSEILLDTNGLKSNTFSVQIIEKNTTFVWRVRTVKAGCYSDWSAIYSFKTLIPAPELTTPANRASKVSVLVVFDWTDVTDATSYDIEISQDSTFTVIDKFRRDVPVSTLTFAGEPLKEKTKYFWHTRSVNLEGKSEWSSVFSFTTGVMTAPTPKLLYPYNEMVKTPLVVDMLWFDVANADSFEIQIAKDEDFTIKAAEAVVTDSTYKFTALDNFTQYYWKLRAINEGGTSSWSDVWTFRSIAAMPNGIPQLILPADNAINTEYSVKLSWSEISNAYAYQVQVSKTNDFSVANLVDDNKLVKNTYYYTPKLDNNTSYFWRVKPYNEAGEGEWSSVRKFTTYDVVSVNESAKLLFDASVNPNPANVTSTLTFKLPEDSNVKINLITPDGRIISELANRVFASGIHNIDLKLNSISSGTYFYSIETNNKFAIGQFVISK